MPHVPIVLNTGERTITIIGGGVVAERKAEMLLKFGVHIQMVAEEFTEKIQQLPVERSKLKISDVAQVEKALQDSALVIIATDNAILNSDLECFCLKKGILYNRIDDQKSPVIFPATVDSNGVIVSVSTSGRSPAFARYMRDYLSKHLDNRTVALPVLEKLRLNSHIQDFHKRSEFFQQLLHDARFWTLIGEGKLQKAYEYGFDLATDFNIALTRHDKTKSD